MNSTQGTVQRWAVALLALLVVGGCAVNPVTGRRQLALISEAQEIQIGRQAAQEVEQTIGLVDDGPLQAYVQRLGADLAALSHRPELPWTFRVVDDPTPNAFALPGGYIFVTRGLLNVMDSEAELATVLGHEIAHVTARHAVAQISKAQAAQLGLGLGLGIGSIFVPGVEQLGDVAGAGLNLLFLKYGRDAEREADDVGFDYALEAGYDVQEADDIFATLQRIGEVEGRSPLPGWLATHPAPAERIQNIQERLAALQPPEQARLGRAEYFGQIDGLVYGENPRAGFFRDGVFYHPELRFRVAFPDAWRTQNTPQAVLAVSPQRDAVAQLTLAGQLSAAQAAQRFLAQQGVQAGRTFRETINGIPAVISTFQANTQQGTVAGLVAFLEYGGRTYQILTYAPGGAFSRYDQLFQRIVASFAPVTDRSILAVQPNRIDIVRLERNMSLAEFNRRYPSVIPLSELAILNQVADETSVFQAGTLVKRVIPGDRVTP